MTKEKQEKRGISVYGLREVLLKEVLGAGLNSDSTIYELEDLNGSPGVIRRKGLNVRCPMFGCVGAAYVHCLEGEDYVGDATHMLSYSWGYSIGDIVSTLESFCESKKADPKRTYVWICCLCNNQHKIVEDRKNGMNVSTEKFEAVFKGHVEGVGKLICMMSPWEKPKYLSRVWCIFEIYTAMMAKDCEVFVEMPPRERKRMWNQVISKLEQGEDQGSEKLIEAMSNTKAERAEASVAEDKEMILKLLQDGNGIGATNRDVSQKLREWYHESIQAFAVDAELLYGNGSISKEEYALICKNLGDVFCNSICEYKKALSFAKTSLSLYEDTLGPEHPMTAKSCRGIARVLWSMGQYEEALVGLRKALAIQGVALGMEPADTATTYNNIGSVLMDMGQHRGALVEYCQALAILEAVCPDSLHVAALYNNIGLLLSKMGQHKEALVEHRKALAIREVAMLSEHPDAAASYNNIGMALAAMDQHPEALVEYRKALVILEVALGSEHPDTAASYSNIGSALSKMGQYEEALVKYRKALVIAEVALGSEHPFMAGTYNNIGFILATMGQYEEAWVEYQRAMDIWEEVLCSEHPDIATSHGSVLSKMGQYKDGFLECSENMVECRNNLGFELSSRKLW